MFNPSSLGRFFKHIFRMGLLQPLHRIINTEGYVTLNLIPRYSYRRLLSIDTKISTNH